tara:strand:+ start:200 stop:406 length:207 start_codon:yes stop_codon:yes gene_type:complete
MKRMNYYFFLLTLILGGCQFNEFRYCSDVAVWRISQMTDGSNLNGHPDYKGIYETICNKFEPYDQYMQ